MANSPTTKSSTPLPSSGAAILAKSKNRSRNAFFIGVLIVGFIGGTIGGLFGIFALNDYFP